MNSTAATPAPRRYRILINGVHAKTGGGVTYLRGILPLLADNSSFELHLFLHREQFPIFSDLDERIRLHLFEFRSTFFPLLAWEQIALPLLARSMAADVLFSPANFGPFISASSVILLRNSLSVVESEARLMKRLYWMALACATLLSIIRSNQTIAVSKYAATALTRRLPSSVWRKISIVHHGVRPDFIVDSPAGPREDFLLVVADIYIQKNLHTMLEAVEKIRRTIPKIQVRVAGRIVDYGYFHEIERIIDRLQLRQCIKFLGPVNSSALIALYRSCRVFVFPSTVETFGHPLVEAMASGAPIASSNSAAMPEILGDAGLYFDPLDDADMADKIIQLYTDAALRAQMSERGRARARLFSLEKTASETAEILKRAARPSPLVAH
jgi:glycosyltransferase involved in cell wall biosynthesis